MRKSELTREKQRLLWEVKVLKNSCYSIERRLCLRLFLFLALYAIIGFAVLLLSNYVLEVFPSSVCTWISQRLDVLFALYLIIGFPNDGIQSMIIASY